MWVVPQSPCNTDNTKTVTVNSHGKFQDEDEGRGLPHDRAAAPGD